MFVIVIIIISNIINIPILCIDVYRPRSCESYHMYTFQKYVYFIIQYKIYISNN